MSSVDQPRAKTGVSVRKGWSRERNTYLEEEFGKPCLRRRSELEERKGSVSSKRNEKAGEEG